MNPPPASTRHRPTADALRRGGAVATPGLPVAAAQPGRRLVVRLIFVIYLLAIFEGSLRKWVLPEFGQYIFFVRDPFLAAVYVLATRHGLWPRQSVLLTVAVAMCGLGVLLVVLQAATGGASDLRLLLGAYGWRSYFFYVPLAPLVGAVFRPEDLMRLYRLTLLLAVPIAVLVAVQFSSPVGAAVNVGNAADESLQFHGLRVTGEHTRPMGTFSSGAGQQQFVATAFAILVGMVVARRTSAQGSLAFLALSAASVLTCIAFSGSRGTVLQCGLSIVFALGLGLLGRSSALKRRAILWTVGITVAAVVLYPIVFPEGFAAFAERWVAADNAESKSFQGGVFGRALFSLVEFVRLVDTVPVLGWGLGFGGNASITMKASIDGVMPGFLAEADYARHMVDLGPVFGSGYLLFRIAVTTWLAAIALRATRRAADPMPMLLLSYVAYVVSNGQITGQGAINVYGWLFTGVLIAACRHASSGAARQWPRSAPNTTAPTAFHFRPRTVR